MPEFPPPIRLFGEPPLPAEPYDEPRPVETPVDDADRFGAEEAAARLTARLAQVQPAASQLAGDGSPLLSPPFSLARDHFEGPVSAGATLVVFGAFGTPASRPLGRVIERVRARHMATARIAWRHFPDAGAHPHAVMLALAAEAAAARGRFWALTRELLSLRHDDPVDLHAALLRAGLDPERTLDAMRAGTGEDRIADDVASAMASGVAFSPALFLNGERYTGELDAAAVSAAVAGAIHAKPGSRTRDV
jgi:2-hydroxychromene-2-carboxylate isomerase